MKDLQLVPASDVEDIKCDPVKPEEVEEILSLYVPQMEGIVVGAKGWGLAAPQVGIKKQFFIIKNPETDKFDTYFNAFYVRESDSKIKVLEGCLSYGINNRVAVKRFKSVRVISDLWQAEKKQFIRSSQRFRQEQAIAFQHEIDHLSGITIFTK